MLAITDANGHSSSFSYNDNFPDGNRNTYAFVTVADNALGQAAFQGQYDYSTGQPTVTADLNGHSTLHYYADPLDHPTQVTYPNGANMYYSYPNTTTVFIQQDQNTAGDKALKTQNLYDGLGRLLETDKFDTVSSIANKRQYDALGRLYSVSNPYRPGDTRKCPVNRRK